MHTTGLPKSLWGETLRHMAWLKNRTVMQALDGKTPFEALYGRPPNLSTLQTWGSQVWVHNPKGSKLDVRTYEARWLGPDVEAKAHHVFWPSTGNVTVEQNIYFGMAVPLKGEDKETTKADSKRPAAPKAPSTLPLSNQPRMPTLVNADEQDTEEQEEEQQQQQKLQTPSPSPLCHSECIQKPS